jgi:SnoaL-like domain
MRTINLGLLTACLLTACTPPPADSAALSALQQQVAELQAREQIRELFTAYGRTLDSRNFAGFGELFADDAEYAGGGYLGVAHGPQEIAAMLEDVITTNASGANLHTYSNEHIELTSATTATAQSRGAFYVQTSNGDPTPLMFATYNDEFIKVGERWLFQKREVLGDIPGPANEVRAGLTVKP